MSATPSAAGPGEEQLAMLSALVEGDVALAYRLAAALLSQGVDFVDIAENILRPVQREVGRRWAEGDLGVADEHAASAASETVIARLGPLLELADGPAVVVASPELDAHGLGGRVVATALALAGFQVRYLGASVPTADLAEYLELQQPLALALSVSIPSALPSAVRAIEAAHALRVPVVIGGSAVTPQRARRLGADAYASDARDAASVLERWQRDPVVDLGAGPSPLAERDTFERHAHSLVASSVGTSSPGQARDMRLEDEIDRVVRVVEAGLLLDDRPLVAEHVGWLRQVAPLHGIGIEVLDAALSRLVAALADGAPRASEILRSAMR